MPAFTALLKTADEAPEAGSRNCLVKLSHAVFGMQILGTGVAASSVWSLSPVASTAAKKAERSRGGFAARCND